MSILKIPNEYKEVFVEMQALDKPLFDQFVQAISEAIPQEADPKITIDRLAQEIGVKLKDLDASFIVNMLYSLMSLYLAGLQQEFESDELADEVIDSLLDTAPFPTLTEQEHLSFKDRLLRLLNANKKLGTVAKAAGVLTDHQRIYRRARVLSDLRPIFEDTIGKPEGAVITHMLKISYAEDGRIKDFYVALNTAHLGKMRETLERAERKAQSLRETLKSADIPYFSVEE